MPFFLTRMFFLLSCVLSANTSASPVGKHLFGSDAELFKKFCNVASNAYADLDPQNDHLTKSWLKEKGHKRKKTSMNVVVINLTVNPNMEVR